MKRIQQLQPLLLLITVLAGITLVGCDLPNLDVLKVAPTVTVMVPLDKASDVAINTKLVATFDTAMDPATIVAANFTLKAGTTAVAGEVSYLPIGKTVVFAPSASLAVNTLYTATLTTGVKNSEGTALAANLVWTFTTGALPDTTAPVVTATVPLDTTATVALNATINATFSEVMDPLTLTSASGATGANMVLTTTLGSAVVNGTVSFNVLSKTAVFVPATALEASTNYTVTIGTGAKDLAGNALANAMVWAFTTSMTADVAAPNVISTVPLTNAVGVAINDPISAEFNEAIDTATIVPANFSVTYGFAPVHPVDGTVTYDVATNKAIFAPLGNLVASTVYTVTVSSAVKDTSGNSLAADKVWSFTTAAAGLGPSPVVLGTAGDFVILAKTGISTVPASVITGNVGISPAAESFATGFSQTKATGYSTSPQITGFLYAADSTPPTPAKMTTAIGDMVLAYTDAATRAAATGTKLNLGAGAIGGLIISPGLYTWSGSVTIPTDVTIEGSGGANDVWIFQIAGDLSLANTKQIVLTAGAKAKNIFWQVTGSAAIGTGAHFEGIILGKTSIALGTGATMNGRALAQTLVALNQATLTKPAP